MNIRLIDINNADACNDFHNRFYGTERTIEQWMWEFTSNINNYPQIPFAIVEDEGRIVGTQAFILVRMIDEDGIFWTAKSEETLLDTAYRGKNLLEEMYQFLLNYTRKSELRYIWGFTPAIRALKNAGFLVPATTSQIFFPFSKRSIKILSDNETSNPKHSFAISLKKQCICMALICAQLFSSFRFLLRKGKGSIYSKFKNIELRSLEDAPTDAGDVSKRFIKQWGGKTIYRDADYLRWRIFSNPYVKAIVRAAYDGDQLLGWVAYSIGDDGVGYLVDIFLAIEQDKDYSVEDIIRLLLIEAVIGTRNMGAVAIRGWHVNNHPFDVILKRVAKSMGFYHIKKGHAVVLYLADDASKSESYDKFSQWYVSRIYTEGVLG